MKVAEVLSFKEYYRDKRFAAKIPKNYSAGKTKIECGDNIYKLMPNGKFRQLPSHHSNKKHPEIENSESKEHDLNGINVLISKRFHYLGKQAIDLSKELRGLKVGIGYKNKFSEDVIKKFLSFIAKQRKGFCASPAMWDKDDYSNKTGNSCGSS